MASKKNQQNQQNLIHLRLLDKAVILFLELWWSFLV